MPEVLTASVVKRLFVNQETDYAVLRVTADGEEFTVRGALAAVGPGAEARFEGEWEEHSEYGRQLAVSACELILPSTEKGIAGFLASGVLPGIGMEKAKKIVRAFGTDTFDIIDKYPGRLAEIPGISKKNLPRIIAAWKKLREERSSMAFFLEIGISRRVGKKLMKELGPGAAQIVRDDPYRLASDVSGIGFQKADTIAANLGIAKDNPQRIAAGIIYYLEQTAGRGHTCYPADDLVAGAAKLLDASAGEIAAVMGDMAADGRIIIAGETVWSRRLWHAEKKLASCLLALAGHYDVSFVPETVTELNREQLAAVETALSSGVSVVTGGPGTGKTTVVGEIVRRAEALGMEIQLAAPTGRAAKRLAEATGRATKTIHRMLGFNPGSSGFIHNKDNPLEADLVIVDEVSMLDVELAAALAAALRKPSAQAEGAKLLLVGDADQLPSVGPGKVMADVIASGRFPVTRLIQVYRQQGNSGIITNAGAVNSGHLPGRTPAARRDALEDFYWIECEDPARVQEILLKLVSERIPERFGFDPVEDIQVLTPMNRGECGTWELNHILRDVLNSSGEVLSSAFETSGGTFRIGDKVMQVRNDYDRNVFNGDLGRIVGCNHADRTFSVCFDGERNVEYDFDSGDGLRNAYAATVHKAQGGEFPAVVMVMLPQQFMLLDRKMLYTAITRAKKLFVLIAPERAVSMAVRNFRTVTRYSELANFLKEG